MPPQLSVIIVNFNGGEHLARCLDALSRQTLKPREVLLVDNASSDGSLDHVRERHPEVRLLTLERNLGFAAANNLAAREVQTDWLVTLNPDAFPEPGWLQGFADAVEAHPLTAAFTGLLLQAEDRGLLDGTGDVYNVSGLSWRRDHGRRLSGRVREPGPVFSACAASAAYRRGAFLEAGGFDEDFFCYMEDVDLGFRLRLLGHECRFAPDAVALHVGSGTTGTRSAFSVYHGHRNLVWVYLKNMPPGLLWRYLPLHLALNLVSLVWIALRGQPGAILRAKWDALWGLGPMLAKRRQIQTGRKADDASLRRVMSGALALWRRRAS